MCERMLRWRIVAPTAPDTLWAYPMRERDPFVIEETPDWFIVGNQQEFGVRTVKTGDGERKCTIVLVPRFEVSGEVVVLDLEKGEVEGMIFGAKVEGI